METETEEGGVAQMRETVMGMAEHKYFVDSVSAQRGPDLPLEGYFWVVPQNFACCSLGSVDIRHSQGGHWSKASNGQGHFEVPIQSGVHPVDANAGHDSPE